MLSRTGGKGKQRKSRAAGIVSGQARLKRRPVLEVLEGRELLSVNSARVLDLSLGTAAIYQGDSISLAATVDTNTTVSQVNFFLDSDHNGIYTSADASLGSGTSGSNNVWTLTGIATVGSGSVGVGKQLFFAQATDGVNGPGNVVALPGEVLSSAPVVQSIDNDQIIAGRRFVMATKADLPPTNSTPGVMSYALSFVGDANPNTPTGYSFYTDTGTLIWEPTSGQVSTAPYHFQVTATFTPTTGSPISSTPRDFYLTVVSGTQYLSPASDPNAPDVGPFNNATPIFYENASNSAASAMSRIFASIDPSHDSNSSDMARGASLASTLIYNPTALPSAIVQADVPVDWLASPTSTSLTAQVLISDHTNVYALGEGPIVHYSMAGLQTGQNQYIHLALPTGSLNLTTGDYKVRIRLTFSAIPGYPQDFGTSGGFQNARISLVNGTVSDVGNRWSIAGLDQTYVLSYSDGVMLVRGDGQTQWFNKNGATGAYQGGMSVVNNRLRWSSRDGAYEEFDISNGRLLDRVDALGNDTWYGYYSASDTSPGAYGGKLKLIGRIGLPAQVFTYDSTGKMIGIEDFAGRVTTLAYQNDLLSQITKPDGTIESFNYDTTTKLLTSRTNHLGQITRYEYDSLGRLARTILPDGSSTIIQSPEVSSVAQRTIVTYSGSTPIYLGSSSSYPAPLLAWNLDSFGSDVANNTFMGAMGRVVDPSGNVTHFTSDPGGYITSTTLPIVGGTTAPWTAGPSSFSLHDLTTGSLVLETSASPSGSGMVSSRYGYDSKFNLTASYLNSETVPSAVWSYVASGVSNPLNKLLGFTQNDNTDVYADRTTGYTYYANGLLQSVTDAEQNVTTFTYTDNSVGSIPAGLIASIVDANGVTTTFDYYDGSETAALIVGVFPATGRLERIVRADSESDEAVTEFKYDVFGNVSEVTDADGRVTSFSYDILGRITQVQQRGFSTSQVSGPTWSYTYDHLGRLDNATDANGNRTLYLYDLRGQVAAVLSPDPAGGGQVPGPETVFFYTPNLQVDKVIDPLGRWTDFDYDSRNQLVTVSQADPDDGTITVNSPQTQYAYNDAGYLTSVQDAEDNITRFDYDANYGWLLDVRSVHKDVNGNDVSNNSQASGPLMGLLVAYTYNAFGDQVSETVPIDATHSRTSTFAYDDISRLLSVTQPDPDGGGALVAAKTVYEYDDNGNLRFLTVDPYDVTTNLNGLNQVTEYVYDHLNRLKDQIDPIPTSGGSHPTTHYTYNLSGSPASLTDPNGNVTSWTYDAFGHLDTEVSQGYDSGTSSLSTIGTRNYDFDPNGNLTRYTDRNGRRNDYTYDALNRMTTEEWFDSSLVARTLDYAYDLVGNVVSTSDPSASLSFAYDKLNRNTSTITSLTGLSDVTLTNQFDAVGNRQQLSASIGTAADFVNQYSYDGLYQLTGVSQASQTGGGVNVVADKQVGFLYNDAGQLTQLNRFNHLVTNPADPNVTLNATTGALAKSTFGYDEAGRLTSLAHTPSVSSAISHSWTYDASRVIGYTNSIDGATSYAYDDTNQLTGVSGAVTGSFAYDANGNRTSGGADVDPGNRLMSDGTYTYTYDSEGNRLSREDAAGERQDYVYDHRNRLIEVKISNGDVNQPSTKVAYEYDTFDRLVSRTQTDYTYSGSNPVPTTSTVVAEKRVYDGDHVVLDFAKPDGGSFGLAHRYLYGNAVDQILAQEAVTSTSSAGSVLWMLTDNQSSVRDLLDNSGSTVSGGHYKYDAYGQILNGDTTKTRYLYTGRDLDATTGLQYNRARWYDSQTGRWMSEDPIGFGDGPNPFLYVHNNPTSYTDPSGLEADGGEGNTGNGGNGGGNTGGNTGNGGSGGGGSGSNPENGDSLNPTTADSYYDEDASDGQTGANESPEDRFGLQPTAGRPPTSTLGSPRPADNSALGSLAGAFGGGSGPQPVTPPPSRPPSFLDDYWRYLTNPWDQDRDLRYGSYAALGTAGVAGGAAGGLAAAGAFGAGSFGAGALGEGAGLAGFGSAAAGMRAVESMATINAIQGAMRIGNIGQAQGQRIIAELQAELNTIFSGPYGN
jgi:RHS repeat-associated protein